MPQVIKPSDRERIPGDARYLELKIGSNHSYRLMRMEAVTAR